MFVIIVNQILKMLLLLLLGCLCFRMRLIDENGSKVLANLLLMVVNPMLAIVSLQTSQNTCRVKQSNFFFGSKGKSG